MATVATGTPRGIWTIDSSESSPSRAELRTGTPITGQRGHGREHPGQVGGAAGAGDDHAQAPVGRLAAVGDHVVRGPVGGHDPHLVGHAQLAEHVAGAADHRQVAVAAHDDADERRARRGHHKPDRRRRAPGPGEGVLRPSRRGP